jgi:hypothetical protein
MITIWALTQAGLLFPFACVVAVFWAVKKLGNWVSEIQSDVTESQATCRTLQLQISTLQRLVKQLREGT